MSIQLTDVELKLYNAIQNSGQVSKVVKDKDNQEHVEIESVQIKDVLQSQDLVRFMPKVIQVVLQEAIEPDSVITQNCFYEVDIKDATEIQIGAIGAMEIGKVSERGEYPEAFINIGTTGQMVKISPEKFGIKLGFTDEVIEQSMWPIVRIWLDAAGRAFSRHQEVMAIRIIDSFGVDVFNNFAPAATQFGNLSGRDITGAANGSMTLNDIFDMYAYLAMRGFIPDTMIMHPLAWKAFSTDPEVREIVINGATLTTNRMPNGIHAPGWGPTQFEGLGLRTIATGGADTTRNWWPLPNPWTNSLNPMGATFNLPPKYLPTPMKVLVSPYVPFNAAGGGARIPTTNIYMLDSRRCGVFAIKERPTSEEWRDPERDLQYLKLRAKYGFGILEQGKAVAVSRNVVVDRNYVFDNVNTVTLAVLNRNAQRVAAAL